MLSPVVVLGGLVGLGMMGAGVAKRPAIVLGVQRLPLRARAGWISCRLPCNLPCAPTLAPGVPPFMPVPSGEVTVDTGAVPDPVG